MMPNHQKSRPQFLMDLTAEAVSQTRGGVVAFADKVADLYEERVPAEHRRAKFKPVVGDLDQISAAQKANRQTVDRYIRGEVKAFPSCLEEAWVLSLPEPFQEDALRELAGRYGMLPARIRGPHEGIASISTVTHEFGDFIRAMAPILADGVINEQDRPYIKSALGELADLQAALASVQQQLTAVLPDEKVAPVRRLQR